jgi:hypothetical protein
MVRSKGVGRKHKAGTGDSKANGKRLLGKCYPNLHPMNKKTKNDEQLRGTVIIATEKTTNDELSPRTAVTKKTTTDELYPCKVNLVSTTAFFNPQKLKFFQKANEKAGSYVLNSNGFSNNKNGTTRSKAALRKAKSRAARAAKSIHQSVDVLDVVLDYDAFAHNKNGTTRSQAASRKAKSRAVLGIIKSIETSGTIAQQALALNNAMGHPRITLVGKTAGFANLVESATAIYQVEQAKKMVSLALTTNHSKGHCDADKASFVESVLTSFAASPDISVTRRKQPSLRDRIRSIGLPFETGRRILYKAKKKRQNLKAAPVINNTDTRLCWSRTKSRKATRGISADVRAKLIRWIVDHPHVIPSPISNDTLLVFNPVTQTKERVAKLLLEIPVRELHNDLIKTVLDGGLAEAKSENGNVLISDTVLRNSLPPQLRPATERQKIMCGCEVCLSIRSHQSSLNAWRSRHARTMEADASAQPDAQLRVAGQVRAASYKLEVFRNEGPWHPKPSDAIAEIQCNARPYVGITHPHWMCVLGRCVNCPAYPVPQIESNFLDTAPSISFHQYVLYSKCTQHGSLQLYAKECAACNNLGEGTKKGKIQTRKHLTLLTRSIGVFMEDFYLPALQKYKYHIAYVIILSKRFCGTMRDSNFKKIPLSVKTRRDYAERLSAVFTLEVQSGHFGNSRSLSIEGSSVETFSAAEIDRFDSGEVLLSDLSQKMQFHSHFSDASRQDAATTHSHMVVLLNLLKSRGELKSGRTILFDETDGCGKQYRCGNALYLLSVLSAQFQIVIDRAIGAPGHGKDIVDGLSATDKQFLRKKMCMIGTPEANDGTSRMAAHSMVENASKSLAEECVRLCSDESRIAGVKSHSKHVKREANATITRRNYHIQKIEDVSFTNVKMKATGFLPGPKNGLLGMYNLRTDPDLGIGKAAVRRIPCGCQSCTTQLLTPWSHGIPATTQPRYAPRPDCDWAPIFQGLNDWLIVDLVPTAKSDEEEIELAYTTVLKGIATIMSESIKIGEYGAFNTDDEAADGYYLVRWASDPYSLQEDVFLDDYDPPLQIVRGELVCDAFYCSKIPRARQWYTPPQDAATSTPIRLQQVLVGNLNVLPVGGDNRLPNNYYRRRAEELGAFRVSDDEHDMLQDEIARRDLLDYDETVGGDEDASSVTSMSGSESEGIGDGIGDDNDDDAQQ